MQLLKQFLYFCALFFCFVYIANATPCRKRSQPIVHSKDMKFRTSLWLEGVQRNTAPRISHQKDIEYLKKRSSWKKHSVMVTTTLAPQIDQIMSQLKDTNSLKDINNSEILIQLLKEKFHTTTFKTKCSKCSKA